MSAFEPIKILSVELEQPLPYLNPHEDPKIKGYTRALVLVRLHTCPLGILDIEIPANGLSADKLAEQIWLALEKPIKEHLEQDGISLTQSLNHAGFNLSFLPACLQKQQALLGSAPLVSVVIATRDRVDSLQACLQSIFALDYPNFEVIVVDNAPSSSATADFMQANFSHSPQVRYIREDIPGLAIAHNRALTEVKAPIVAFTDDDVLVDPAWLKSIVAAFQEDSQVGCVTGMILPYEIETPPQLWIEQFGGFGKGYQSITFDLKENRPKDFLFPYTAGRFGSGANMAFRTEALITCGGFDPALGAGTLAKGGDDLAIFFEVITRGYRLTYQPGAVLYHKHRRDYPGLARQAYGYGIGLSAFLTKTVVDKPTRLFEILSKIPAGLKHILDPRSPKNQKKLADYPRELTQLELKGFLAGPLSYLRSRWQIRKLKECLPIIRKLPNAILENYPTL